MTAKEMWARCGFDKCYKYMDSIAYKRNGFDGDEIVIIYCDGDFELSFPMFSSLCLDYDMILALNQQLREFGLKV